MLGKIKTLNIVIFREIKPISIDEILNIVSTVLVKAAVFDKSIKPIVKVYK